MSSTRNFLNAAAVALSAELSKSIWNSESKRRMVKYCHDKRNHECEAKSDVHRSSALLARWQVIIHCGRTSQRYGPIRGPFQSALSMSMRHRTLPSFGTPLEPLLGFGDSANNANGLDSFRVEATRFHAHDPESAKLEAESLFDAWNLAQNPGLRILKRRSK
jgi:hypothetical protein